MIRRALTMLDPARKRRIRNVWAGFASLFCRRDLTRLASLHKTDKLEHGYMPIYQKHFAPFMRKSVKVLEIGIGGYADPWSGGNSLRMWAAYFAKGRICGIDIEDKHPHETRRITVRQGDQSDPAFLAELVATFGAPDIVIDDGSHFCQDVIASFKALFPQLNEGGLYVIEDTQTSYWQACGGSMDPTAKHTTMHFFQRLTDGLNHAEFPLADYEPSYLDLNVAAIHFYHNMIFVEKGSNTLPSNVALKDRQAAARTD